MNTIKVLFVEVGGGMTIRKIPNELYYMQQLVGGHIECVHLFDKMDPSICLICDEEGVIKGKFRNIVIPFIVGDFFLCSTDGDEFVSLSDEQIILLNSILKNCSTTLSKY